MENLVIDKELEEFITPLSTAEYSNLEDSIRKNGVREPIIAWVDTETGLLTVVDGHNRYKIAQMYNIPYEVRKMEFSSKEAVKRFMLFEVQDSRRNLDKEGVAWAYMVGREYRQSVGKRGDNLQNGKAEKTGKSGLLISEYSISLPTAKRAGKLYEAIQYVAGINPDFPLLKTCLDEGKKITQKNVLLLANAHAEQIKTLTDTDSLYHLLAELKGKQKKTPIAHSEPSEAGEETNEEKIEMPLKPSKANETREMQALRDKSEHYKKLAEKQTKTIAQQTSTIARQNDTLASLKKKIQPIMSQVIKIAEHFEVLRLSGNRIEHLFVEVVEDSNTYEWKTQEELATNAEAKRIFSNYEDKPRYFCLK